MNKRLKALEKRVKDIEQWLTSRDASADAVSAVLSAPLTAGAVIAPTAGVRSTEGLLPRGLSLNFDDARATITIEGVTYGYEFFRQLGVNLPVGSYFHVLRRSGGSITIVAAAPPPTERDVRLAEIGRMALAGSWWYQRNAAPPGVLAADGFCLFCFRDVPTPYKGGTAAKHHSDDCPIPERP